MALPADFTCEWLCTDIEGDDTGKFMEASEVGCMKRKMGAAVG
jgi:hypothetical protein